MKPSEKSLEQSIETTLNWSLFVMVIVLLGGQMMPQPSPKINGLNKENVTSKAENLADCQNLPPICQGGLLSEIAGPTEIDNYILKYKLQVPFTCRFMYPPRCFTNEKRICKQQCTP